MKRFLAEWIIRQHFDEIGEWIPDKDEYSASSHTSLEAAKTAAIDEGKRAGASEWWEVREQEWTGSKRTGRWETITRWYGDWEGNEDEEIYA